MRRKAVEKLIDARIARQVRPPFNRPISCDAMMATNGEAVRDAFNPRKIFVRGKA